MVYLCFLHSLFNEKMTTSRFRGVRWPINNDGDLPHLYFSLLLFSATDVVRSADTCVLFFRLAVLFFASGHIRWMNRHPVSLRGGQTCFSMAFHHILRQTLS